MSYFLTRGKGAAAEFMVLCPRSTSVPGLGAKPHPLGFGLLFYLWENFSFCIQRTKVFTLSMPGRAANTLTLRHGAGSL